VGNDVGSVQRVWQVMHRDEIAPRMRTLGFRRSSWRYWMQTPEGDYGDLLFERNPKISTSTVTFFHIHVRFRSRYRERLSRITGVVVPIPPKYYPAWDYSVSLNELIHGRGDPAAHQPMQLRSHDDPSAFAATLLDLIQRHGVPAIHDSLTDVGLADRIEALGLSGYDCEWSATMALINDGQLKRLLSRFARAEANLRDKGMPLPERSDRWWSAIGNPFRNRFGRMPEEFSDYQEHVGRYLGWINEHR
jgi:hypothetical protein